MAGFKEIRLKKEWLVKTVPLMYVNAQSRVRVNGFFSNDFLV